MLVFINGSLGSGKTSTARLVAEKLGAEFIDFDDIRAEIPDFNLETDIPRVLSLGAVAINQLTDKTLDVVANYVLSAEDYRQLNSYLTTPDKHFFTLAPRLEVIQDGRGRELSEWELHRIKHHYDSGITRPDFGIVVDSSDMSIDEVADTIIATLKKP